MNNIAKKSIYFVAMILIPVKYSLIRCRLVFPTIAPSHGVRSMSRKGNCWDNAVAESFFGIMKTELVYHERYDGHEDTLHSIFEYIEAFYNRERRHSALGYYSEHKIYNIYQAA
jgi:hypothetical protein